MEFFNFWTPLRFADRKGRWRGGREEGGEGRRRSGRVRGIPEVRREKLSCNQLVVAGGRDLAMLRLDVNHLDKAA